MPKWHFSKPMIPARAIAIAIAALVIPFVDTGFRAAETGGASTLLWLLALIPAFLLAYYRGWRGVATALAGGMAVLTAAICIFLLRGSDLRPEIMLPVLAAYIGIALAAGWLSERLHAGRERAELMALTDDLTGLPNRRHAKLYIDEALDAATPDRPVSVIMLDLDRFKAYNDRHGHAAGDVMLCTFANVLNTAIGENGFAARYGDEEFVVVLSPSDGERALAVAERIRADLSTAVSLRERMTASAGTATYGSAFRNTDELLRAAENALSLAKQKGRDRVCTAVQSLAASM